MTRPGLRRAAPLLAALALLTSPARATDCAALRAAVDAAAVPPDPARLDAEMQRRRDAIVETRAAADRTGCGDGLFDDPDSPACRALARRAELLQIDLRRLQDRAFRDDAGEGERRRDLQARFDAECSAPAADEPPGPAAVPADPDAPAGPAAAPNRAAQVFCVRQCDGAYYPLAADVPADRLGDMDRVCQAQCPGAASAAYADDGSAGVGAAVAMDGSRYDALATAFQYQKGPSRGCACRAPHQSWAEALAGAEALLQPHKGDVTVTAELAAAMARPAPPPGPRATPAAAAPRKPKARAAPLPAPPPPAPGRDLTTEFRRGEPTL